MRAETVTTTANGADGGGELVENLGLDDPNLLLLFPSFIEAGKPAFQELVDVVNSRLDGQVCGVSVGGFATPETSGFETNGTALLALDDVSFRSRHIDDVWNCDREQLASYLDEEDGTKLLFAAGSRDGGNGRAWRQLQKIASHIIENNVLGQRKRLINRLSKKLDESRIAYTEAFRAHVAASQDGNSIVNYFSGDAGRFRESYEIWGEDVTEKQSGTILYLDRELPKGGAVDARKTLDSDRVLRSFDSFSAHNNIIYRFDGHSLTDFTDEYAVAEKNSKGGFSYYLLIEQDGATVGTPLSSDLGVVVSYTDIDGSERLHLARTPSFKTYMARYEELLDRLVDREQALHHISINQTQLELYRNEIDRLVDKAEERLDTFFITIDNALRQQHHIEYNFPSYVSYENKR